MSHFAKKNLKQTFQEYVTTVRFNQALKLLLTTNMKLTDICFESGFSDPRYLNKAFVKRTGMKPEEYKICRIVDVENNQGQRNPIQSQIFYTDEEALDVLDDFTRTGSC